MTKPNTTNEPDISNKTNQTEFLLVGHITIVTANETETKIHTISKKNM